MKIYDFFAVLDPSTGFFNPYSAHGSYYPCPTGTFASAAGSSACTACPVGKFSAAQHGATACSSNCTVSVYPGAALCAPGIVVV